MRKKKNNEVKNSIIKGRVILNRNICDNAPECSGIEECPTGALYWDEENERIEYDENKCINCGNCAKHCPVEAILFGIDEEDYLKKKQQVENDTRRLEELKVERYGASPIDEPIDVSDIDEFIKTGKKDWTLLELFSDDSIDCLLHSIRIEEIKTWFPEEPSYSKVYVKETDELARFEVSQLPALIIFNNKALLGGVCGHYSDNSHSKEQFKKEIDCIVSKKSIL